jgi:uncharacterized membrane protein YagU involved in acid resistance
MVSVVEEEEEDYKERIRRKEVVKNGLNKNLSAADDNSNGLSHVPFKLWFIIFVSTLHSSIFFAVIYVVCKNIYQDLLVWMLSISLW